MQNKQAAKAASLAPLLPKQVSQSGFSKPWWGHLGIHYVFIIVIVISFSLLHLMLFGLVTKDSFQIQFNLGSGKTWRIVQGSTIKTAPDSSCCSTRNVRFTAPGCSIIPLFAVSILSTYKVYMYIPCAPMRTKCACAELPPLQMGATSAYDSPRTCGCCATLLTNPSTIARTKKSHTVCTRRA